MNCLTQRFWVVAIVFLCLPLIATAQIPNYAAQDGPFHVRHAVNLSANNDTIFNFTNTGASYGAFVDPDGLVRNTDHICVSIYVFTPDEQLQECCNVSISVNSLWSASAFKQLTASPVGFSPFGMSSVVVKMMSTSTNSGVASCPTTKQSTKPALNDTTYAMAGYPFNGGATFGNYLQPFQQGYVNNGNPASYGSSYLANGLAAWARTPTGETEVLNSTLSAQEWLRNTELCEFIRINGSGPGFCQVQQGGQ